MSGQIKPFPTAEIAPKLGTSRAARGAGGPAVGLSTVAVNGLEKLKNGKQLAGLIHKNYIRSGSLTCLLNMSIHSEFSHS